MLRSYLKTAWRNIIRYKFYSAVNIIGLFAGIAIAFLIGAFVWGELQVNKKLRHADQQYILRSDWKDPGFGFDFATVSPLAKRLKEDYPSLVANYYRFDGITSVVSKGDKHLRESIAIGDSTFLTMYGFKLLQGNPETAMANPFSVVITREMALKYFGKLNAVGETIGIQSYTGANHDFLVTGVLNDIPQNSVTLVNEENNQQFFIPSGTFSYFNRDDFGNWGNFYIVAYIELQKGVSPKDLEAPIKNLIAQNAPDFIKQTLAVRPVPLADFYMQDNKGFVKRMLYTLGFAGLFILLMAIVNFVNIAISRSATRIREVGIRKVLGGMKKQLVLQFLIESVFIVGVATLFALAAYPKLAPLFSQLVGKKMPSLSDFPLYFILIPPLLIVLLGLIAGIYPAFVLTSLKSVDAVKGKFKTIKESTLFRKSLVGFQFSIALVVLIAAIIVTQQVSHFFSRSLGYDKEYVVSAQVPRNWSTQGVARMETIRNEFAGMPEISNVSLSFEIPDGGWSGQLSLHASEKDPATLKTVDMLTTDANYLDVYHIPLVAGSVTTTAFDSTKIMLNKKAAQVLGWQNPSDAIGKQVRAPARGLQFTVSGITDDFHFGSMRHEVQPLAFVDVRGVKIYRYLSFKIKPGNVTNTINALQKKWATFFPDNSFEYRFMDDTLKGLYSKEFRLKKAAYAATSLTLVIVLLGVLGLVSLSLHKRVKEIGIRKVLGASVRGIVLLFIKEFTVIIILSAIIACPIAWMIMQGWLEGYVYRIDLGPQPFLLAVGMLCLITLSIIGLQTLKAARTNPVNSLKTE